MPPAYLPPAAVRRASYVALGVALLHIIFGAIVRISGSGMGCGDNWPTCQGYWLPPYLTRIDLAIELTHRYLAIALFASIAWLVLGAWRARADASVGGDGGVWNSARLALVLWFAPALFGAVTVYTGNPAWATVVHKLLATSLLAVLVISTIRAGGLGGSSIIGTTGEEFARIYEVVSRCVCVCVCVCLSSTPPRPAPSTNHCCRYARPKTHNRSSTTFPI